MSTTAKGLYHPYAHARGATVGSFRFTGAAGANPTAVVDPGGIVLSAVRDAGGSIVVTLKRRYSKIDAIAQMVDATGKFASVDAITAGGTVDNKIEISTFAQGAAAPSDQAGKVVIVSFYGYDT